MRSHMQSLYTGAMDWQGDKADVLDMQFQFILIFK